MKQMNRTYQKLKLIVLHFAAWVGILSIVILLFYSANKNNSGTAYPDLKIYQHLSITVFTLAVVFYVYYYLLIPRLLYLKRFIVFVLISLLQAALFVEGMNLYFKYMNKPGILTNVQIRPPDMRPPPPSKNGIPLNAPGNLGIHPPPIDFPAGANRSPMLPYSVTLLPFLMVITASIALKYINDGDYRESQLKEQKMAALSSELQFLKSQISPHFLFNVLNNLTYHARKNTEMLEPSLQKLSSLLRYMLYDTNEEKVLLDKEIKYLEDYVGLREIRHQDVKITTNFFNDYDNLQIAPMLLIPFVENAFKHASGFIDGDRFIVIELLTNHQYLTFSVTNKYTQNKIEPIDNASGIGLANVKKRLELLYPANHYLSIQKGEEVFSIFLQIKLSYS
ncbi:hypothetical protein GD597_02770 [Panacibacter sp. KCS-6]|uniref:Signal transduction histidine kinase internal region domain-containing protein n=2 Tax=Limnovirga soli TaxID=2656915 RepID=A0A8J8FCW9_9BACT|nr:hypothetical protein [Limnovirga soli]